VRLFGGSESRNAAAKVSARIPRASSGWAHLLKSLRAEEGQRILDIGPTSSGNINFLTGMGHSIYMSNPVAETVDTKWSSEDPDAPFPVDDFLNETLNFSGRQFDTVLFWDTADFLRPALRQAVIRRLYDALVPGGQLLGFFHTRPENGFHRYHLRDDGQVESQQTSDLPVFEVLNNRQIENLFRDYSSYKFFLAKDNLREVVVTR
jgi:SAM-dependent methyltransferase